MLIVDRSLVIVIYCEGGYREMVAAPDATDAINLFYCYPGYISGIIF